MKNPSRIIRIVVAAMAVLFVMPLARAATDTWTGGGGSANLFWLSTANWNPAAIPQAGDELVFTNTIGLLNSNNIPSGNFKGITFATPSGAFVLNGSSVTLSDNITNLQANTPETINLPIALGGTVNVNIVANSVLNLNNVISSSGALSVSGPGLVNLLGTNNFTGGLTVAAGGTLAVNADTNLGAGTIVLNGGGIQNLLSFDIKTNRSIALGPTSGSGSGFITTSFGTFLTNGVAMGNNGGGSGGLTHVGFGVMRLFGSNVYTGSTSNTIGTIVLDFTQPASPISNIISSSSALTMGGGNAGPTTTNYAQLLMAGTAAGNSQTFASANFTLGASVIGVTNLTGSGLTTLNLGALSHDPNSGLTFFYSVPALAKINTTSPNVGGILGGWATIAGDAGGPSLPSDNLVTGTNWACVDLSGNIVNFNNFYVVNAANHNTLHAAVDWNTTGVETNILVGDPSGVAVVATNDIDNAGTTTDINSIKFYNSPTTGGAGVYIGLNNTLRLGVYGGILSVQTANTTPVVGGVSNLVNGASANQAPFGSQNAGILTAGGPNFNTPGEIVITHSTTQGETTGGLIVAAQIADNGPNGKVTVVKMGNGSIKLDGNNTYSGGLYMLQGRVQWQGTEIDATGNGGPGGTNGLNDGAGFGPVYVLPGSYFAPSTAIPNITNDFFIAGAGGAREKFGVFRAGNFGGNITMVGDATMCSDAANVFGPITGPFNLTIGTPQTGGRQGTLSLANSGDNWTGNTTMSPRSDVNILTSSNNEVIPNGFGKGNVNMSGQTGNLFRWNMNGFSETLNGFSSDGVNGGGLVVSNGLDHPLSTLAIGDNNQSGTFGGIITSNIAVTKIGAGVETFTNVDSYTGATTISNGVLQLGGFAGSINKSTLVNINGGTFGVSSAASYGIPSTQTININGGTFFINTANSGTTPVNITNGTLEVTAAGGSPNLTVPTLNIGGSANVIQVVNAPLINTYPTAFPIIKYTTLVGIPNVSGIAPTFSASLPTTGFPPFGGFISNDTATTTLYLVFTNGPVTPLLTWVGYSGSGVLNSSWDFVANDWTNKPAHQQASYTDGSLVVFDDGGVTNKVDLNTADVYPAGVTFSNNAVNYTLRGNFGIRTNSLTKQGTGKVTLDNALGSTNDYAGGTTISGGILQVGINDAGGGLGSGAIGDNGTLVFNRNNSVLTVANAISGTGGLLISNAASTTTILSGNSSLGGDVYVVPNMTLAVANANALSSTNGTLTIPTGSTLEVGGLGIAANSVAVKKTVNVIGAGVDSTSGAILNSAGTNQQNALLHVTLAGDTTLGGAGRFDIRGTGASLSTGGAAYNLTKKGAGQFSIVGATVDPALNNVDVQGGTLSVETSTSGLGNSSANLTMENGTTLQLYNLSAKLNKQISMGLSISDSTTINGGNGSGNTIIGPMSMNGFVTLNAASGATLTLSNAISGTAAIVKSGTNGTVVIAGTDNHNSGTTINDGTYILNAINNNGGNANQLTENISLTAGFTTTLGGNGTNAAPADIEDTLWPGVSGKPSTFGVGDGVNSYNGDGSGALAFGDLGNTAKAVFSLNNNTTVGAGINDLVVVNGDLDGGNAHVLVNPLAPLSAGNVYTVVQYNGARTLNFFSGVAVASSVPSPNRYNFSLSYAGSAPNSTVQLNVLAGPSVLKWNNAQANGIWDVTNNFNWLNTVGGTNDYFAQQDSVVFDDSIINSGGIVTLTTTNLPFNVTVNTATNYTFAGAGKISGTTSLTKMGTGTLTISNANDYTGVTLITNGILQVVNSNAVGAMTATVIVTNNGAFDVGGNTANEGIIFTNASGDIKPFIVSGWGYQSNGVIINSGSVHQQNAFQNITMAGDTAFGGPGVAQGNGNPGRWDMRGGTPTLSTGGHAYNFYKVGTNQISLVGVNVDTNLADIYVLSGELGIETATSPTVGNPNNTIWVSSGASFEFFSLASPLNKNLVLNGGNVLSNTFNLWFNGTGGYPANTIASPVIITNGLVTVGGTGNGSISNIISGPGSLAISGNMSLMAANTYTGNTIISNSTLTLRGAGSISTSPNITMASGTTIDVSARANNTLTLASGQTLAAGSGTINGSLTNLVGTVSLTGTNGAFTVTTNATFGGSALIANQLDHGSNSVMVVNGNVTYGGTLTVTTNALSTTTLTAGTVYRLFQASTYSGVFSTVNLPALPAGLSWTNGLAVDGRIGIVSAGGAGTFTNPTGITSISLVGNNVVITGTNGQSGDAYYLLSTTNVAGPWSVVATNVLGASGNYTFIGTNTVTPGDAQQFYILSNTNGVTSVP